MFVHVNGYLVWCGGAVCKTIGSATLVLTQHLPTQHLPPPAKTARWLRRRGPAGRFLLARHVSGCVTAGRCHCSGYGHIDDSVRAERAVHMTARLRSGGLPPVSVPGDIAEAG